MKLLRKLQDELDFGEEEHKKYQFKQNGQTISWDETVCQTRDISIGDKSKEIITAALGKLNDGKELQMEHFDIYEKFVNPEGK